MSSSPVHSLPFSLIAIPKFVSVAPLSSLVCFVSHLPAIHSDTIDRVREGFSEMPVLGSQDITETGSCSDKIVKPRH